MIRRLIILLLIVGCAPTKPPSVTFYLGMGEKEFIEKNNIDIDTKSIIAGSKGDSIAFSKIRTSALPSYGSSATYTATNNGKSFYYFEFADDTLMGVYRGYLNYVIVNPINYSKYPNSNPQ